MKMTSNGGRALIVHIISAGACVSGRSVWLSKCSKCALGSIHLNISFMHRRG